VYYTWSDTTNNPVSYSSTVSGLPAGDYTLTVMTDCGTLSCTQTVSQFPELTVFGCSSTDACFGGSTGTVDAGLVSGSVGMVNYMWVNDSADIVGTTPYVDNLVPGNYYLTVTDNCNTVLCDLFINATDTLQSSFSTTACEAYMLPWGTMANVTGDYTYNYSTSVGCDSIVTAHVEVNTNFSTTFTDSAYLSYTLPWGIAVSLSGDYTYTYVAANGCDSIVTAKITILIPTGVNEASVSQKDLFEIVGSSLQISDMVTRSELYNVEGQIVPNDNLAGGIYLLRIIYRDKIFIFKIKM
jgi:hypothetical protein